MVLTLAEYLCRPLLTLCKPPLTLCKPLLTLCKPLLTLCKPLLTLCRYQQSGVYVQHLSKQQQLAANALHRAAHTGLLDVVLVRITQTQEYIINGASDHEELHRRRTTTIDGWQTLSGMDVAWASTAFHPTSDLTFQA